MRHAPANNRRPPWPLECWIGTAGWLGEQVATCDARDSLARRLRDYLEVGDAVWERFSAKKDKTLWYYRSLVSAYRAAGAKGFLVDELDRTVTALEEMAKAP